MSTKIIYRVQLCLPSIGSQDKVGGRLILEESTTDPGYQKGKLFEVTKKVAIQTSKSLENEEFISRENKEFTFSVTVLEHQISYVGDTKFVDIMVESPDRITTKAYADALNARNFQDNHKKALATRSRGYTDKTHLRGFKTFSFS